MVVLGVVLLGLGVAAAWNVHEQHQRSSKLIAIDVKGMTVAQNLYMAIREIRYQINMFLRSGDWKCLDIVASEHVKADKLLSESQKLAHTDEERKLLAGITEGYTSFFADYQRVLAPYADPATHTGRASEALVTELTRLSDKVVTENVLQPIKTYFDLNEDVVEKSNQASQETAQHLKVGFLLLGICGGVAGLLLGMGIARGLGRSIVQLNVSIRGVAGKLKEVTGPVTVSLTGDLAGVETGLRNIEDDIANVVERLQQRETELLRSEQLARVGQLAAGLAHEFRNPLMPMKVLVQSALERGDEGGLKGRSLQVISDEIARLEESIQAFLDFARPPEVERTSVNVNELVRQTTELVRGRAHQQFVEIRCTLPETECIARIDRTQIRQLLLNLLLNALDAMKHKGLVEVTLEPTAAPPALVGAEPDPLLEPVPAPRDGSLMTEHDALRLRTRGRRARSTPSGRWFSIRVADDGPGIPPDVLDTIFEPFVTTKETGTGLGLSICQRIATAHHGQLVAANRPYSGAQFTLTLPYEG